MSDLEKLEQKRSLERKFIAEDMALAIGEIAKCRRLIGNQPPFDEILFWLEHLIPLGVHPTEIIRSWSGYHANKPNGCRRQ